jgi:hypothetical protein
MRYAAELQRNIWRDQDGVVPLGSFEEQLQIGEGRLRWGHSSLVGEGRALLSRKGSGDAQLLQLTVTGYAIEHLTTMNSAGNPAGL